MYLKDPQLPFGALATRISILQYEPQNPHEIIAPFIESSNFPLMMMMISTEWIFINLVISFKAEKVLMKITSEVSCSQVC